MTDAPRKIGRPSSFTPKLADEICGRLVNGESLRAICRDEGFPAVGTVLRWVGENADFREQYARARELQAETLADEIVSIADDAEKDQPSVAKARLQVDSRKWVASKLLPKKYGDKIAHVGGDPAAGDKPIQAQVDVTGLGQAALAALADVKLEGE